ncbi:CAP domain-containing protein [uncultured Photobacterium sp.]|uniref:CAP domain-containing protein n=1 Tax=uncultured Photobacterium sp. TaxID=173973 RepID=UPI00261A8F1D|nr:CAP domain-containing protein [uncultured Photobacterium sp.]
MRKLSLLLISMFVVTGCGSGGGSESGTVTDNGSSNTSSNVVNSGDTNTGGSSSGSSSSNDGNTPSNPTIPTPDPNSSLADQMLAAVNAARAQARSCGGEMMPAVGPLTWDYSLEQAAFVHSSNMANYNFFSHTGQDGTQPADRVSAQGYNWRSVGENIAAGQKDVSAVMTSWLNSPGHCKNIMSANYTQMGAASVTNSGSQYGIYWTQNFARPR